MSLLTEALQNVNKHVVEREIGGQIMRLETGEVAKQAGGSVVVTVGETVVPVTPAPTPPARASTSSLSPWTMRRGCMPPANSGWLDQGEMSPERTI